MKHLAIDIGRYAVKVVGPNGYRDWFTAYVGESQTLKLKNDFRSTDITLSTDYGSYFIGDLAKDESHGAGRLMTISKIHQNTKSLALAAVARAVESGEEVIITTGVPVDLHTEKVKKEMAHLLKGNYAVVINRVKKHFTICDVRVSVEGPTAYMVLCRGMGGTKRFIDLGSRMMNYGTVRSGRFINKESGSMNYGCETVKADLVHRLVSDLSLIWPSFEEVTYLLGGGAKQHSTSLTAHFPRLLCAADPYFTNVLAYFEVGEKANAK